MRVLPYGGNIDFEIVYKFTSRIFKKEFQFYVVFCLMFKWGLTLATVWVSAKVPLILVQPNSGGGRVLTKLQKVQDLQYWKLWISVVTADRML